MHKALLLAALACGCGFVRPDFIATQFEAAIDKCDDAKKSHEQFEACIKEVEPLVLELDSATRKLVDRVKQAREKRATDGR